MIRRNRRKQAEAFQAAQLRMLRQIHNDLAGIQATLDEVVLMLRVLIPEKERL